MDKTFEINAGRSGVRIPGRSKCSLRTIAVDSRINYQHYQLFFVVRRTPACYPPDPCAESTPSAKSTAKRSQSAAAPWATRATPSRAAMLLRLLNSDRAVFSQEFLIKISLFLTLPSMFLTPDNVVKK